jgi:hypothetical protein
LDRKHITVQLLTTMASFFLTEILCDLEEELGVGNEAGEQL